MRKPCFFSLFLIGIPSILAVSSPVMAKEVTTYEASVCYPSPFGLTDWWPGEDSTDDVVGERGGTLHGDATFGPGLVGQAFILDGNGDFVSIPRNNALNFGTGDFTIALWARFNETAGEQVLLEKWVQKFPGSRGWTLTKLENNVIRMAMGADFNLDSAPLAIEPDTWYHFAATRESGEVSLFLNGQPVASGTFPGMLNANASLKFGHRGNPIDTPGSEDERGFYLNGRIDEVQLLIGRALPENYLRAIYDAGNLGSCPAPKPSPDLPNLAAAKPIRASRFLPEAPPQNVNDGEESRWGAGSHPPQWVEIDLQKPAEISLVRLTTDQYPAGVTAHQIWGAGPGEELHLLYEFRGFTDTKQVLAFWPEPPLTNIQTIRVLTTESPSWVAWDEIEVYGTHEDPTPGIDTLRFDISEYAGQTVTLELTAEGGTDYAGLFVNAVSIEKNTPGSDPCEAIPNCEFEDMANDPTWQRYGTIRYRNLAGESTGSWWGNDHTGGFWHDATVFQNITVPLDASLLAVEVCTSCLYSTDGTASPTEYNARLSVRINGRYLTVHANPRVAAEVLISALPAAPLPTMQEATVEKTIVPQPTVQLLYPGLKGAFIELHAQQVLPELWTRVQWQDAFGNWHDIDGWQGSFNPDERVSWYVGEEHLGDGPFRWLIFESQQGDLLAMSQAFNLPSRGGEVLSVAVSLPTAVSLSELPNVETVAETAVLTPTPGGLLGQYYNIPSQQNPPPNPFQQANLVLTRVDETVDFYWPLGGQESPDPVVQNDMFAVKWTGMVYAPVTGTYTFGTSHDDGVRLYVNDTLLYEDWQDGETREVQGSIPLIGETWYPIRLEFWEYIWTSEIHLFWRYPGQEKIIIQSQFLTTMPPSSLADFGSLVKTVSIEAQAGWINTGIQVEPGNQIEIVYLSGMWTSGGDHALHDADGTTQNYICSQVMRADECVEPIPNAVKGSLIARIGDASPFLIGNEAVYHATSQGPLMFSMNDTNLAYDWLDNVGSIVVRVAVTNLAPGQLLTTTFFLDEVPISSYLSDNFDDSTYDGRFNSTIWTATNGCTDAAQSEGIITFQSTCDLAVRPRRVPLDEKGIGIRAMAKR